MTTSPVIDVRGLHKQYGTRTAVNGIDLQVHQGEIFALLGPNGAGKTTTVEILEGYRKRSAGSVSVLGMDPQHANRAWRNRIGLVLQSSKTNDELSVTEAVHQFARYYANPRDPDEVISLVGLDDKRGDKAAKLSGGQQRRLDVALGIVGRPELLFLDEPTTGFDPEARRQFWTLIKALRQDGTTIVLTTHYLDEAEVLADRVGVIANGQMIEISTPDKLGGRNTAKTKVQWTEAGEHHEASTDTPTAFIASLCHRLGGAEVNGLRVSRPSLEDIYLTMIGVQP